MCARARSQVAIDGDVLDISAFMDHHPGGPEIISELRGRDASQMFLDVGHSPEARTMLRQFVVGKLQAVPRFLAPRSALLAAASWLQPRSSPCLFCFVLLERQIATKMFLLFSSVKFQEGFRVLPLFPCQTHRLNCRFPEELLTE